MLSQPDLPGVSAICSTISTSATVYGDVTLAQALRAPEDHPARLLLIAMSATLDATPAPALPRTWRADPLEGRAFPSKSNISPSRLHPTHDTPWYAAAEAYEARHARRAQPGDALIFMPGAYEIQRTLEALPPRAGRQGRAAAALHGELAPQEQTPPVAATDQKKSSWPTTSPKLPR
jgi:ATP-dependent helicase HrpB